MLILYYVLPKQELILCTSGSKLIHKSAKSGLRKGVITLLKMYISNTKGYYETFSKDKVHDLVWFLCIYVPTDDHV